MVVGGLTSLLHAVLVITFRVEQIVSGLAITILAGAAGLSSYLASSSDLAAGPIPHRLHPLDLGGLSDLPGGRPAAVLAEPLTYLSWVLVVVLWWYLFRTRRGLHLRAVGESPATADAMGIDVPLPATPTPSSAAPSPGSAAPSSRWRSSRSGPTG